MEEGIKAIPRAPAPFSKCRMVQGFVVHDFLRDRYIREFSDHRQSFVEIRWGVQLALNKLLLSAIDFEGIHIEMMVTTGIDERMLRSPREFP